MNEEQTPQAEKVLNSIKGAFTALSEQRDIAIREINESLDRIKRDVATPEARKLADGLTEPGPEPFVPWIQRKLNEMDVANEKLYRILKRINDLI